MRCSLTVCSGLALFIAELAGVYYTGGSLNPARSFAPSVVNRKFYGYHWIYWLGPLLGAMLAVAFYKLLKKLEYELANPGADDDEAAHDARARVGHDGAEDLVLRAVAPNAVTRKGRETEPSVA